MLSDASLCDSIENIYSLSLNKYSFKFIRVKEGIK